MIAYPPQKRPTIKEQFEAWKAVMETTPDPTGEHVASHLRCPVCGDALAIRWGRNAECWMVYHLLSACESGGATWRGDTREEAITEFQNFSGSVEGHAARVSPAVAEGLGLTPQSHPQGIFQGVPLKDRSGNQAPPAEISPPLGAATFQGMEFSAEGLDEEQVNSLLTEHD